MAFHQFLLGSTVAISASFLAFGPTPARADAESRTTVPTVQIYAPYGFDSNDTAQVVVSGYLPNLCYHAPRATPKINGHTITITVDAVVRDNGGLCAMMIVPFIETVSLGALVPGSYHVQTKNRDGQLIATDLTIVQAPTSAIDNYVYANVSAAVPNPDERTVRLTGYNPSPCFVFDRFEFVSNGKDTLALLPIMKQINSLCPMKMTPFELTAAIPTTLVADTILIHVRSMNGKSINTLFDNTASRP